MTSIFRVVLVSITYSSETVRKSAIVTSCAYQTTTTAVVRYVNDIPPLVGCCLDAM
jgi:hypothetical protein